MVYHTYYNTKKSMKKYRGNKYILHIHQRLIDYGGFLLFHIDFYDRCTIYILNDLCMFFKKL